MSDQSPAPAPVPTPTAPARQGNGMATSGFVVSLIGAILGLALPVLFFFVALVMGIVGLVLSGVGWARARAPQRGGMGLAIAGVVLGVLAVIFAIIGAVAVNDAVDTLSSIN